MQCPGCGIDVPSSEEIVGAQVSLIQQRKAKQIPKAESRRRNPNQRKGTYN